MLSNKTKPGSVAFYEKGAVLFLQPGARTGQEAQKLAETT